MTRPGSIRTDRPDADVDIALNRAPSLRENNFPDLFDVRTMKRDLFETRK